MSYLKSSLALPLICIFSLSLILRIWFNFFDIHPNAAFAFDAAEYLRHSQSIDITLSRLLSEQPSSLWSCLKVLFGNATFNDIKQVKDIFDPLKTMSISGPVFPLFLLFCFKLFGKTPSFDYWMLPIAIQCILTSLVPVFIAAIGNICWNRKTGLMAGVLAVLYPGFIVASGRLYSESFASFLICLVIWLLASYFINNKCDFKSGLLLGISLFALQMTRSIMAGLTLSILLFLVFSCFVVVGTRRPTIKYLLAIITGLFLCLLPWLGVQKLALGKTSIIVDRVSNYNLLVGNDVDGLGWLSIPYQDCSKTEQENYAHIMKESVSRSPQRWFKLMLDKPMRLFKLPWNDFKTKIGIVTPFIQSIFHQLILALAIFGLILSSTKLPNNDHRKKVIARFGLLLILLLHFIYLFFITLPRYALTAMPEVLLFAGAGLALIAENLKAKQSLPATVRLIGSLFLLLLVSQINIFSAVLPLNNSDLLLTNCLLVTSIIIRLFVACLFLSACWQMHFQTQADKHESQQQNSAFSFTKLSSLSLESSYTLLIIVLVSIFAMPAYCLPLRAHGRWFEWSIAFNKAGQEINKTITIDTSSASRLIETGSYLLVNIENGSSLSTNTDLLVNNIKIHNPIIPSMAIYQNLNLVHLIDNNKLTLEQEFIFKCLCDVSAKNPADLRQWYLIPISGKEWQSILNADPSNQLTITNPTNATTIKITLQNIGEGHSTIYGAYANDSHCSVIPSLSRFSWEKAFYSAESESDVNDPAYDEKVKPSTPSGSYIKLLIPQNTLSKQNTNQTNILSSIDQQEQDTYISNNQSVFFQSKIMTNTVNIKDNCYLIQLQGEIIGKNPRRLPLPQARMHFSKLDKDNKLLDLSYDPAWLPIPNENIAQSNDNLLKFNYCFPAVLSAFPGRLSNIELMTPASQEERFGPTDKNAKMHIKCHLRIYEMTPPLSGMHYDIF